MESAGPNQPARAARFARYVLPLTGALLAGLLAMTPLLVRFQQDAGRARALSDSMRLGRAILAFHLDTGVWPVDEDADPETGEISRLVGLPADQMRQGRIPGGEGTADGWRGETRIDVAGAIEDHLIRNRSAHHTPLYPESSLAPDHPGWNGPYLRDVPLDPWGHPYVCNTRHLEDARIPGVTPEASLTHAVLCLSAGPNGVYETPLADEVPLAGPAGDDVGWAIQPVYVP